MIIHMRYVYSDVQLCVVEVYIGGWQHHGRRIAGEAIAMKAAAPLQIRLRRRRRRRRPRPASTPADVLELQTHCADTHHGAERLVRCHRICDFISCFMHV